METQFQYIPVFFNRFYRNKYFLLTNLYILMQLKYIYPRETEIKNHTKNVTFYLHNSFQIEKPLTKLHSTPFSHSLNFSVMYSNFLCKFWLAHSHSMNNSFADITADTVTLECHISFFIHLETMWMTKKLFHLCNEKLSRPCFLKQTKHGWYFTVTLH